MADDLTPRERFANRLRWHFDVVADEGRGSVYIGVGVQNALNDLDAMVAEERARHDDLAAALAALAEKFRDMSGLHIRRYVESFLADPAAVLAERDRRMKAEAIRGAITALRQGAENLSLGDDVVSYLRGAERAATEHADREGGRV